MQETMCQSTDASWNSIVLQEADMHEPFDDDRRHMLSW